MQTRLLSLLFLLCGFGLLHAQSVKEIDLAKQELKTNFEEYGLDESEIDNFIVSDHYISSYHGASHLYLWQTYQGVPVYNGIITFGIKEGNIYNIQSNAEKGLASKIASTQMSISAQQAIQMAASQLGFPNNEAFTLKETKSSNNFVFESTSFASNDIPVFLVYEERANNEFVLAWNVDLDIPGSDYWSTRVDAQTGNIIAKNNYTVYCTHDLDISHSHTAQCKNNFAKEGSNKTNSALVSSMMGGTYRVYAAPAESPNHGPHELLTDPADLTASPFGWHDTDGVDGAEFTITRGNNVHAYLDKDIDDMSDGAEPDGGMDLVFDFPHDLDLEPGDSEQAAQVNLFYMNNFLHDFTYKYGFDEAAGNFQENNYGNGGAGADYVLAESADGSGTNNANFGTPPDGGSGRMQMFLWGASEFNLLTINDPNEIAGKYEVRAAGFGGPVTDVPVTGDLVFIDDGTSTPTTGCDEAANPDDLDGKIVVIDRGECDFSFKTFNAQNAGAIGVIVCNIVGVNGGDGSEIFAMGAGDNAADVTIPAIMATYQDCVKLRASIEADVIVNGTIQLPQVTGPMNLDASFDNGVIAHELGHGISNRLTGGPAQAGCLGNDEQMGEGWSDFYALVTSVEPGDLGDDARGIGTYVQSEPVDGAGIRRFPYSTDLGINPETYDDIIGTTAPHPLGSVWTACVWDMYWELVDLYGYDADIENLESGNARAIRLVTEGMKEQGCEPGFVSGRQGIVAADNALYNGDHYCLISKVFARRGVGFDANQESTNDRNDGTEGFMLDPICLNELVISKTADPIVTAGQEFGVEIVVTNFIDDPVTDLVVTDEVPVGASFVAGSSNYAATVNGDMLTFEIGAIAEDETITITYNLFADEASVSTTFILDDMEDGEDNWDIATNEGTDFFELSDIAAASGENAWYIFNSELETDNELFYIDYFTLQGDRPALKFNHRYNTEAGADGGFVAVQEVGQLDWTRLNFTNNIRNGFDLTLQYGTFALPSLASFSGDSDGFVDTYLDLSEFAGKDIRIQFRFGTDDNTAPVGDYNGWSIDDFEIIDLKDYTGQACATANGQDPVCANGLTIVESNGVVAINKTNPDDFGMEVFPNPATDLVNISITAEASENATLTIIGLDGNRLRSESKFVNQGKDIMQLNVADLAKGVYFIQLKGESNVSIKKLVIN